MIDKLYRLVKGWDLAHTSYDVGNSNTEFVSEEKNISDRNEGMGNERGGVVK